MREAKTNDVRNRRAHVIMAWIVYGFAARPEGRLKVPRGLVDNEAERNEGMTFLKKATAALTLLFFCAGPALAQRVVRVTDPAAIRPAEVAVAINPKNPDNIVGASFQSGRPPKPRAASYTYVTTDGGKTWKTVPAQDAENLVEGDDALAFGGDGTAYHAHLSFDGIRLPRPKRAESGILVSSSRDGGLTWDAPVPVINHVNTVTPFEDKPAVTTDNAAGSRNKGNVYLAWTRFDEYGSPDPQCHSHIYFSRSADGGKTFSMPFRISDAAGDCLDSDNTVEGAVPAVGPRGEVYVVWAGPLGLVFDKSTDGGLTFGKDEVVGRMPGGWDFSVAGLDRANGMPVTGVDLSAGPNKGTLYVNWIDERNGDPDVFVASSRDGGGTWSAPVRVNDDALKNGKAQFFTWLSVDSSDGSVNVAFYDRRDTAGTLTALTLARSTDGGRTFVNYKIEQEPFACDPKVFFGDYLGVAAYGGRVVAMYMHFVGGKGLAVSAALFRFRPGTQERVE
jgi:BNR/Asp-box repeat